MTHSVVTVFWKTTKTSKSSCIVKSNTPCATFTTLVLYRNTQQDLFDIVILRLEDLYHFVKQRFKWYCAIILRDHFFVGQIRIERIPLTLQVSVHTLYTTTPLYRKRDLNSQNSDSKSDAFTISPFLHLLTR